MNTNILDETQINILRKILEDSVPRQLIINDKIIRFSKIDPTTDIIGSNYNIIKVIGSKVENTTETNKIDLIGNVIQEEEIDIIAKKYREKASYVPNRINEFVAVLYFIKKYPNDCTPLTCIDGDERIYENIHWDSTKNTLRGLSDIEISKFNICKKTKNIRFIYIFITLEYDKLSHANCAIYDNIDNSIEIYEPHGFNTYEVYHLPEFYKQINIYFKNTLHIKNVYIPTDYCPNLGHQLVQEFENIQSKGLGMTNSLCSIWSIWWIDFRLKNANTKKTRKELYKESIKYIKKHNGDLTSFIINYTNYIYNYIIEIKNKIISSSNLPANYNKYIKDVNNLKYKIMEISKNIEDLENMLNNIQNKPINKDRFYIIKNKTVNLVKNIEKSFSHKNKNEDEDEDEELVELFQQEFINKERDILRKLHKDIISKEYDNDFKKLLDINKKLKNLIIPVYHYVIGAEFRIRFDVDGQPLESLIINHICKEIRKYVQ